MSSTATAAGEAASGVSNVQGHGLAWGGDSSGSSHGEGDVVVVDDGGPDFCFVCDPQQLIRSELGSVGGFGESGFGEQIIDLDGDHH